MHHRDTFTSYISQSNKVVPLGGHEFLSCVAVETLTFALASSSAVLFTRLRLRLVRRHQRTHRRDLRRRQPARSFYPLIDSRRARSADGADGRWCGPTADGG